MTTSGLASQHETSKMANTKSPEGNNHQHDHAHYFDYILENCRWCSTSNQTPTRIKQMAHLEVQGEADISNYPCHSSLQSSIREWQVPCGTLGTRISPQRNLAWRTTSRVWLKPSKWLTDFETAGTYYNWGINRMLYRWSYLYVNFFYGREPEDLFRAEADEKH